MLATIPFPYQYSPVESAKTLETLSIAIGATASAISVFSILLILIYVLNRKRADRREKQICLIGIAVCLVSIIAIVLLSQRAEFGMSNNQRFFVIGATALFTSAYILLRCEQHKRPFRNIFFYGLMFIAILFFLLILTLCNIHWVYLIFIIIPIVYLEGDLFLRGTRKSQEKRPLIPTISGAR